jgi:hypothetical protein
MADERKDRSGAEEQHDGLDYSALSMNEVAASATDEPSEGGRHAAGLALLVIAVVGVAAFILIGIRVFTNALPGQEAEQRLKAKLSGLEAHRMGTVLNARYLAGNRLHIGISPRLSIADEEDRKRIEEAARDVMEVLMEERPGRDLYIDGTQGDEEIVSVRYRHKGTLMDHSGERIPDIAIEIVGADESGISEAAGGSKPATGGR